MSAPLNTDPCVDQSAVTDDSLLAAHEKLLGKQPDEKGNYRLMPLVLLFTFSGLIFFAGTYLNQFSGLYLVSIFDETARPGGTAEAPKVDMVALGQKQYQAACITCHMADGKGQASIYPPLAESEWANGSEERLIRIVLYGLKGPLKVAGKDYAGAIEMPIFGKGVTNSGYNWSDEKIAAVLTYVRQAFGNTSGAITAEKVAEIHAKDGDRKQMSQEELLKLP